jgi:hypothetical protein
MFHVEQLELPLTSCAHARRGCTLARSDKTFGSVDLVRFWYNNLTREEQQEVVFVFYYATNLTPTLPLIQVMLLSLLEVLPGAKILIRLVKILTGLVGIKDTLDLSLVRFTAQGVLRRIEVSDSAWAKAVDRAIKL